MISAQSKAHEQLWPGASFWIMVDLSLQCGAAFSAGWPANLHFKYTAVPIETTNTILSLSSLIFLFQASRF